VKNQSTQSSQLIAELVRGVEEDQRISVLHIGAVRSGTLDFLSQYRCRVQVFDMFSELPIPPIEETEAGLENYFLDLMQLPQEAKFDICLFWDLFDYLNSEALPAFLSALKPHLNRNCRGHGFTVHNPRTPASLHLYGIHNIDSVSIGTRQQPLPNYAPHTQNALKQMLHCFHMERSVLLSDRRLELLLKAR
jgi:hypothetical protein